MYDNERNIAMAKHAYETVIMYIRLAEENYG